MYIRIYPRANLNVADGKITHSDRALLAATDRIAVSNFYEAVLMVMMLEKEKPDEENVSWALANFGDYYGSTKAYFLEYPEENSAR